MDTESELAQNEVEEYMSLKYNLNGYMKMKEYYLKNHLDRHNNGECLCCRSRLRVEMSEKYFEQMLAVINKSLPRPGLKLRKIFDICAKYHADYYEEYGKYEKFLD